MIESSFDIGLKDYVIYKESFREELNKKIIDHFYFREIGLETPQLFKKFLNRKMNEIMPYYNQLYKSCDVEFNPLWNVEMHETFTHTTSDNGKTTKIGVSENNGNSKTDGTNLNTGVTTVKGLNTNNETALSINNSTSDTDIKKDNTKTNTTTIDDLSSVTDETTISNKSNDTEKLTDVNENILVKSDTPQGTITTADITSHRYATTAEHNLFNITKDNLLEKDELITHGGKITKEGNVTNGGTIVDNETELNGNISFSHQDNSITGSATIDNTTNNSINDVLSNLVVSTNKANVNDEINANNTRTETFTRLEEGSSAGLPYSNAIKQWRSIMINIDMLIIEELEPLFMQLW